MTIAVKAYANADDVLIAWQPDKWADDWAGFQLERRDDHTQQVTPNPVEGRCSRPACRPHCHQSGDAFGPTTASLPPTTYRIG